METCKFAQLAPESNSKLMEILFGMRMILVFSDPKILSETVDRPITYHKVRPQDMYVLEYLTSFLKQDR